MAATVTATAAGTTIASGMIRARRSLTTTGTSTVRRMIVSTPPTVG
jgi:hypothetical protein